MSTRGTKAIRADWAARLGGSAAAKEVATTIQKSAQERAYNAAVQQARKQKLDGIVATQLAGIPDFVTEHQFHPERRWRFDYCWPQRRIALEIHGGVFSKSRHTTGEGFTKDRAKMNEAAILGWLVIEATSEQLASGLARDWVERALALRGA